MENQSETKLAELNEGRELVSLGGLVLVKSYTKQGQVYRGIDSKYDHELIQILKDRG